MPWYTLGFVKDIIDRELSRNTKKKIRLLTTSENGQKNNKGQKTTLAIETDFLISSLVGSDSKWPQNTDHLRKPDCAFN